MKTPEQIRIEAKLELWNTPGFSQFLEDLEKLVAESGTKSPAYHARVLKVGYLRRKWEIEDEDKGSKFKQIKLPL